MDKFSYELGKISGILAGLSYVNSKTNHDFTFQIEWLESSGSLEESAASYIKRQFPDAEVTFETVVDWEVFLSSILEKWLFSYQPHLNENGEIIDGGCGSFFSYLKDVDCSFSMSDLAFRNDFISQICSSIQALVNVSRAVEVGTKTEKWYESSWIDIGLEGKNGMLFLHFGVSD